MGRLNINLQKHLLCITVLFRLKPLLLRAGGFPLPVSGRRPGRVTEQRLQHHAEHFPLPGRGERFSPLSCCQDTYLQRLCFCSGRGYSFVSLTNGNELELVKNRNSISDEAELPTQPVGLPAGARQILPSVYTRKRQFSSPCIPRALRMCIQ